MATKPPAATRTRKTTATPAPAGRGKTTVRHIRARDEVFDPMAERADREGFGVAEVTRRLWHAYGKGTIDI